MVLKGVSSMADNKWGKKLLGLLAVGAAVGGAIAYFSKKNNHDDFEVNFEDDFEDEDFDLDDDLRDPSDRGYVSLGTEVNDAAKDVAEEIMDFAEDAKDAAEDFVDEAKDAVKDLAEDAKDAVEEVKKSVEK